jgi:hypothetical protein
MIRFADHSIKDQLKTLWQDAFLIAMNLYRTLF